MAIVGRVFGIVFSLAVIGAAVVASVLAAQRLDERPRTDDAYLQANLIHLAPDVSGRIVALNVQENQAVRAGDVMFVIDPEPYRFKLEQAEAQLQGLLAQRDVTADQVASQGSKADAASTGIGSAQAQLALVSNTLARMEPLLSRGFVNAEQVDQARTSKRTAETSLKQARQQSEEARQNISSTKPVEQQIAAAKVAVASAQRDLRLTEMRAPCDGRVTGLGISAGEYANAGHPLFTLIDTSRLGGGVGGVRQAVGNFRETDIDRFRAGERAAVYVLSAPGRPIAGAIDSIGWGVMPDDGGAILGGLPRVARTLSWVRVAQRFPVRVLLQQPPPELMRIGASVVIVVDR